MGAPMPSAASTWCRPRIPDGEGRRRDHRRQQTLEAVAADRQLARYDRAILVGLGMQRMGHAADHDLGGRGVHLARRRDAMAKPLDEEPPIGIEHDLDDRGVIEGDAELVAERFL